MRRLPHVLLLLVMAGSLAGCGREKAPADPEVAARARRGKTPQETVALVREALERRRYRDVLLHVVEEDRALFTLARFQALKAHAESLPPEEAERRTLLFGGLKRIQAQHTLSDEDLALQHDSALEEANLEGMLAALGALAARTSVDGHGGMADLVPELRDVKIEGDTATALAGDPAEPDRWHFRRVDGGWYYVVREP